MRKRIIAAVNHTDLCESKIINKTSADDISHNNSLGILITPYLLARADARIPYKIPRDIEAGKILLDGPIDHPFSSPITGNIRSGKNEPMRIVIL